MSETAIHPHKYPWGVNGEYDDLTADEIELAADWLATWRSERTGEGLPEMHFCLRAVNSQPDVESSIFQLMIATDEPLSAVVQHELRVLREGARLEAVYCRAKESEGAWEQFGVVGDPDIARKATEMISAGEPLTDIARVLASA